MIRRRVHDTPKAYLMYIITALIPPFLDCSSHMMHQVRVPGNAH